MIKNAGFKNRNTKITHNVWVNLFCSGGVRCSGARGSHIDADGGRGPETPAWNRCPAPAAPWAWRTDDALAGPRWWHLALSFLCAAVVPCQPFSGGRLWGSPEPPVAEVSLLLPGPIRICCFSLRVSRRPLLSSHLLFSCLPTCVFYFFLFKKLW